MAVRFLGSFLGISRQLRTVFEKMKLDVVFNVFFYVFCLEKV